MSKDEDKLKKIFGSWVGEMEDLNPDISKAINDNFDELVEKSPTKAPKDVRELDAGMDNVLAYRLGKIASEAGNPNRHDVGDEIDRGLILRRLLEEKGFVLCIRM